MSRPSGRQETTLLHKLGTEWCRGRGSRFNAPDTAESNLDDLKTDGPGVLYRWSDDGSPVEIRFLPEGRRAIPDDGHPHLLVITVRTGGLEILSSPNSRLGLLSDEPAVQHRVDEILGEIRASVATGTVDELAGLNAAQRLVELSQRLADAQQDGAKASRSSARERFVADLHNWLDGRLESSVKLADAAEKFHKSPRQIIRVLKETTGTGFSEHLTMHRLIHARRLLMRTAESVMQVAGKSGFNSREQFIRSFNKAFGWTPLQFRKAWNQASLANTDLEALCRIPERREVDWLPETDSRDSSPRDRPHTLVVANALHEIVELFSIDASAMRERAAVLERGAMVFIHRDLEGSHWRVRAPISGFERRFTTEESGHCIAVVSTDLMS